MRADGGAAVAAEACLSDAGPVPAHLSGPLAGRLHRDTHTGGRS